MPSDPTQIGSYTITVYLTDTALTSTYTFLLKVIQLDNTPPYYNFTKFASVSLKVNAFKKVTLPDAVDDQGNTVSYILTASKSASLAFITLEDMKVLSITPTLLSQVGLHEVYIELTDGQDKSTTKYPMQIEVTNTAPKFVSGGPVDQVITYNVQANYPLPAFKDAEGNLVSVTHEKLYAFITFDEASCTYTMLADMRKYCGLSYQISGSISDGLDSASFAFNVAVDKCPVTTTTSSSSENDLGNTTSSSSSQTSLSNSEEPKSSSEGEVSTPAEEEDYGDYTFNPSTGTTIKRIIKVLYVSFKIQSVSRDGKVAVKFLKLPQDTSSSFISLFTKSHIWVFISTQQKKQVPFTLDGSQQGLLTLTLDLKVVPLKPIADEPIKLQVQVAKELKLRVYDNSTQLILGKGVLDDEDFPPQINSDQVVLAAKLNQMTSALGYSFLPSSFIMSVFFKFFIYTLWSFLNDLSFLTSMSMIAITVPGISQMIQSQILSFIYLDILMADEWLTPFITNMLDPQGVYVENALSFQFEQSGFGSKNLLINLGSSTIYVLIYLMQMQALLVTMVISRLTKKTYSLQRTLEKGLLWNDSLRFLMQQFQPLIICSLMNFYDERDYSNSAISLSNFLSIAIIIMLPLSLILSTRILSKAFKGDHLKNQDDFQAKFGTLTEGLNLSSRIGFHWNIVLMTRWMATNLILVVLRESPVGQIFTLLSISLLVQALLIFGKPLENPADNKMGLFNEAMVSSYLYIMLQLTDFNQSGQDVKDTLGMGLLVVVLISFFVNLIKLLHVIGNLMRRRVYPKVKAYLHLLKKRFIKSEAVVKMRPAPSIHTGRGNKTMEDFVHEQSMIKNYFPEASEQYGDPFEGAQNHTKVNTRTVKIIPNGINRIPGREQVSLEDFVYESPRGREYSGKESVGGRSTFQNNNSVVEFL